MRIVELGNINDFNMIFTKLVSSKTSISESDKRDIEWFVKYHRDDIEYLLPDEIQLKEGVSFLGMLLARYTNIAKAFLSKHLKTPTDVLRFIVALSHGDVSLAENTKFKRIPKRNIRLILSLLENCNSIIEDMLRYKEQWKRIGERIHPFEYRKMFPKCYEAFDII